MFFLLLLSATTHSTERFFPLQFLMIDKSINVQQKWIIVISFNFDVINRSGMSIDAARMSLKR